MYWHANCNMIFTMHKISKKLLTLFLLVYFVSVVVSSVSAICPADEANFFEHKDSFKTHHNQADLFLFDMAYWVLLKNAKHSDSVNGIALFIARDTTAQKAASATLIEENYRQCTLHAESNSYNRTEFTKPFTVTRLVHSGLSPPFFS